MKFVAIFVIAFVAYCSAAPAPNSDAEILSYENDNIGIDGYKFSYETSDGVSRKEEGVLKNIGTEDEALSVTGSVTWTSPEGQTFTLTFVADETGYHPEGDFLPKPPVV